MGSSGGERVGSEDKREGEGESVNLLGTRISNKSNARVRRGRVRTSENAWRVATGREITKEKANECEMMGKLAYVGGGMQGWWGKRQLVG